MHLFEMDFFKKKNSRTPDTSGPIHVFSPRYSFSAYCVPNDVISGMADTKGLPMGYTVVNQVLNRNAGELVYVAEGYLGFCYDGSSVYQVVHKAGHKISTKRSKYRKRKKKLCKTIPGKSPGTCFSVCF